MSTPQSDAITEPPPGCVVEQSCLTGLTDFYEVFDRSRPVEVDIGCGKGRFLLARAQTNPNIQYLGVERLPMRALKIDKKVRRRQLNNLLVIRLEATYVLDYFIPEHSIQRFYLLFPDPWPKRRHHKRRVFNEKFRTLLWSRLVPGSEIQIATDHLDYFKDIKEQLDGDSRFEEVEAMERMPEEQTDFELIFRSQELSIGACGFRALPAAEITVNNSECLK